MLKVNNRPVHQGAAEVYVVFDKGTAKNHCRKTRMPDSPAAITSVAH